MFIYDLQILSTVPEVSCGVVHPQLILKTKIPRVKSDFSKSRERSGYPSTLHTVGVALASGSLAGFTPMNKGGINPKSEK